MATLPTSDRIRQVLAYCPESGVLTWIAKAARNTRVGSIAGRARSNGYAEVGLDGSLHMAHRLVWALVHGGVPHGCVIDHINGNRADNRLCNLRAVSHGINNRNRHRPAGANPAVGVSYDKARGKWRADLKVGAKCKTLGRFNTIAEAELAYVSARDAIWPELKRSKSEPKVPAGQGA